MDLGRVRLVILRRRNVTLTIVVMALAAIASLLAVNVLSQARQLAAGIPSVSADASPSAAPSQDAATPGPMETPEASAQPTADPTATQTPAATPQPVAGWTLAATYGDPDAPTGVLDVAVWNGTFVAIGTSWRDDKAIPHLWRSADGSAWAEAVLELGAAVSPQVVAPLADGRLMILGTIDDDVTQWSDPLRAAAWASADGVSWTPVSVPFAKQMDEGPMEFAAGAEGFVVTTGDEIWHSSDGYAWRLVYGAPRGSWVYGPVAGDEGWIVKRGNASLGTTMLLVSGDASTWHEVELGNVASVVNVAGDWLATRASEDWQSTNVLHSANGLEWTAIVDLDDLAPPEGTALTANGAMLAGTDEVLVMSPWQGGHCGAMPSDGWGAWVSNDGLAWASAGLGSDAVVTHAAEAGDITILAGYQVSTAGVAFWVMSR